MLTDAEWKGQLENSRADAENEISRRNMIIDELESHTGNKFERMPMKDRILEMEKARARLGVRLLLPL
jgi:hypothetical protein